MTSSSKTSTVSYYFDRRVYYRCLRTVRRYVTSQRRFRDKISEEVTRTNTDDKKKSK